MYFNTLLYYKSCLPNSSAICFESLINLLDGILFTKALIALLTGFCSWQQCEFLGTWKYQSGNLGN